MEFIECSWEVLLFDLSQDEMNLIVPSTLNQGRSYPYISITGR